MLTDEEVDKIRSECSHTNGHINYRKFAREIQRAVLAKAMPIPKQDPVGKMIVSKSKGSCICYDFSWIKSPETGKIMTSYLSDGIYNCYAYPQPAQAAAIPEIATDEMCEALEQCLIDQGWDSDYVGEIDKAQCWAVMLEAASPKPE